MHKDLSLLEGMACRIIIHISKDAFIKIVKRLKVKRRAFLDTDVFVYTFEFPAYLSKAINIKKNSRARVFPPDSCHPLWPYKGRGLPRSQGLRFPCRVSEKLQPRYLSLS